MPFRTSHKTTTTTTTTTASKVTEKAISNMLAIVISTISNMFASVISTFRDCISSLVTGMGAAAVTVFGPSQRNRKFDLIFCQFIARCLLTPCSCIRGESSTRICNWFESRRAAWWLNRLSLCLGRSCRSEMGEWHCFYQALRLRWWGSWGHQFRSNHQHKDNWVHIAKDQQGLF